MPSSVRPLDRPLAWVGHDRVLLDDTTPDGLRRQVIARKDDWPNVDGFMAAATRRANGADVFGWLIEKEDYFYLWIVWKEAKKQG